MKYAVMKYGYEVYGVGETKQEAIENTLKMTRLNKDDLLEELEDTAKIPLNEMTYTYNILVEISDKVYELALSQNRDNCIKAFDLFDGQ